jgi:hypothetical protein
MATAAMAAKGATFGNPDDPPQGALKCRQKAGEDAASLHFARGSLAGGQPLMSQRKRDCAGVRDVEALDLAGQVEPGENVAALVREPS